MRLGLKAGGTHFVSSLPARLVSVTCLMLLAMVLLLAWTRDSGNGSVRETGEARLRAAITHELHRLVLSTLEFAARSTSDIDSPALTASHNGAPTRLLVTDLPYRSVENGQPPLAATVEAILAQDLKQNGGEPSFDLRKSFSDSLAINKLTLFHGAADSGIALVAGNALAWAIVPASRSNESGGEKQLGLLHYHAVDEQFLDRIEAQTGTANLKISTQPPYEKGMFHYAHDISGTPVLISWQPASHDNAKRDILYSILFSMMALYTGFVAYHMTRKLAESEAEKAQLAAQDMLTGLANRLLFTIHVEDEIARAKRNGGSLALLYLDLDRFKEVNDSFGHDAGDLLIYAAARRIEEQMTHGDRLARLSGDEFAILQLNVGNLHDCEQLAERILACIQKPFEIRGQKVYVGISIGIAVSSDGADDGVELMRRADLALYRAKNNGRGRFVFYDEDMNTSLQEQKSLEDDLRQAIQNDELDVYYQPIVSADRHKLACVEALVRWTHPVRGEVPPHVFIRIAEERGLIMSLGSWVLRRACSDAVHWPNLRLAVNISAMQFRSADFIPGVRRTLEETGFSPKRLELEMTESVVIDDAEQAERAIIDLRAMGIRLALDDFGTGYSSLIYLRRFAIDKIKIDRSFVQMMESSNESAEIVRNIADLGRRLGLTVTAEGVENEEQVALLESFGCHELQGYLFGKALSRLNIPVLLAAENIRAVKKEKAADAA